MHFHAFWGVINDVEPFLMDISHSRSSKKKGSISGIFSLFSESLTLTIIMKLIQNQTDILLQICCACLTRKKQKKTEAKVLKSTKGSFGYV